MVKLLYAVCALTAAACAWLLLRQYFQTRFRLLLWSGLCFVGLTVNNVLLILDRLVFLDTDLSLWRLSVALIAMLLLLYGLIIESES
jgi:Family of unknown function (DUF5985)